MCINCAKREFWQDYTSMVCKKCGMGSNHRGAKCWTNHGMCVKCVKIEHPKEYPSKQFRPAYYKLCMKCNGVMVKMHYQKNKINVGVPIYVCVTCKKYYDCGIKFEFEKYCKTIN